MLKPENVDKTAMLSSIVAIVFFVHRRIALLMKPVCANVAEYIGIKKMLWKKRIILISPSVLAGIVNNFFVLFFVIFLASTVKTVCANITGCIGTPKLIITRIIIIKEI